MQMINLKEGMERKKSLQEEIYPFPYRSILIWVDRKGAHSLHFSFDNRICYFLVCQGITTKLIADEHEISTDRSKQTAKI